jgi:nucleoside-diphosphate-sugar epimerase
MANPILVTGAAGRVGAVGRTVTELLLKQGKAVRAMVRNEDERGQALRGMGAEVVVGDDQLQARLTATQSCVCDQFVGSMVVIVAIPFQGKWNLLAPAFGPLFFLVCAVL